MSMTQKTETRLGYMDIAKAIAIYLVILAHCIQYSNIGNPVWKEHLLTRIIISFHMPLFMIISGYFFKSALKKDFVSLFFSKMRQLLVPVLLFGILTKMDMDSFQGFCEQVWMFGWYVKCLFIYYMVTWLIFKCKITPPHRVVLILAINVFLYLFPMPELWFVPKLYLFFSLGMLLREYPEVIGNKWTTFVTGVVFLSLLPFWRTQYSMYFYDFYFFPLHDNEWNDLYANTFRIIMGIAGSLFFLSLLKRYSPSRIPVLPTLGGYTLGIYLMQEGAIFKTLQIERWLRGMMPVDLSYICYSIIIFLITGLLVHFLSKIRICRMWLLGMR